MGKNQHSKDRLFITQTEHKYLYGGKKPEQRRIYRRLPFNCCAITLSPFKNPVCTRAGHLFDLEAIVPYIKEHQINPVNGEPLAMKDLIQLHFHKNEAGEYFCPVTYKVFTDNTKIAAIGTSGNVYAYAAIEELNIRPKNWTDLMNGEKFKRKDIIILQDPQDLSNREIDNFEHMKSAKEKEGQSKETSDSIRTNSATSRIMKELEAKQEERRTVKEKVQRGDDSVSEKDKIVASLTHSAAPEEPSSKEKKKGLQYSRFTDGSVARSFTSSAVMPSTHHTPMEATMGEKQDARWRAVRRMKKKGLVRVNTTFGPINLEIHCDMVPQTADNFIGLAKKGYYDNTIFHRLIPGFMIQGGDPTGTGRGGESLWKEPFKDELDGRLSHDKRGILSMANAGKNTNKSQFFITFQACHHLNKKHAVFGRVVGGHTTLDEIEKVSTDPRGDKPLEEVKITNVEVFADPFEEYETAVQNGEDVVEKLEKEKEEQEREKSRVKGSVVKVGDQWVAYDGVDDTAMESVPRTEVKEGEAVGKYLKEAMKKKRKAPEDGELKLAPVASKKDVKKKKATGGFGDFSTW